MGFIAALEISEGIPIAFLRISMKLILLTTLASLALADPHYGYGYGLYGPGIAGHPGYATSYTYRSPQGIGKRSAEPEPHYGGYLYGPGIAAHPGYATSYTHRSPQGIGKRSAEPEPHLYGQYAWPSVSGPYYTSTCWGCRGKRSADADAHGLINNVNRVSGLSPFPTYTASWPGAHVMVNHMGKRSADPHYMGGVAGHPYGATSYVGRTVWGFPSMGHHYGKRSADADPHMPMTGIAMHPGGGTSYVGRTVWGFPHGK